MLGKNETIERLIEAGFENVKWYDESTSYEYYDATLDKIKVEVRLQENTIEWRYLGVPLEEVEWFLMDPTKSESLETRSTEEDMTDINDDYSSALEQEKEEQYDIEMYA
ncbi:hypothetical protein MZM54_04375 [[Brevibacterium] frigoritolerans]|nr:hypothetical protein [Peribacillus frigoritolerans]